MFKDILIIVVCLLLGLSSIKLTIKELTEGDSIYTNAFKYFIITAICICIIVYRLFYNKTIYNSIYSTLIPIVEKFDSSILFPLFFFVIGITGLKTTIREIKRTGNNIWTINDRGKTKYKVTRDENNIIQYSIATVVCFFLAAFKFYLILK